MQVTPPGLAARWWCRHRSRPKSPAAWCSPAPGSRLPLLLGLFALTTVLAVIALRQLRREQELIRLRSDFTSSVSHELRTPLTQILLFTETLELGRAASEEEERQALGIIGQEARRLAQLVENVLQFSRAERHLTRVRTEPTALAPLMRDVLERFAPLAGRSATRVHTDLERASWLRWTPTRCIRSRSTCWTTRSSMETGGAGHAAHPICEWTRANRSRG